ncbi:hypothetical protein EST38_g12393 [Candolleomyces aberdarensis]|uniref:Uncharacterized protein n=1 Tax=Candolleomyces aberdarensis TaxID=2316362 RepID=A0A4Q2D3A6_9AGAR|nr:hypothetical protein EST38_g12393 [Candolleomyces aberdarensis]
MQNIIECPLNFDSLPVEWEKLPLPELYRGSLQAAVAILPSFFNGADAINDEEVVDFTQNGGWQKINNLLPLLQRKGNWFYLILEHWIEPLEKFADHLKVRKPEAAAVISVWAREWENLYQEYGAAIAAANLI